MTLSTISTTIIPVRSRNRFTGVRLYSGRKKRGFCRQVLCAPLPYTYGAQTQRYKIFCKRRKRSHQHRPNFPSGHTPNASCGAELDGIRVRQLWDSPAMPWRTTVGIDADVQRAYLVNDLIAGAESHYSARITALWLAPARGKHSDTATPDIARHELEFEFHEHERSKLDKKEGEPPFTAGRLYYIASARGAAWHCQLLLETPTAFAEHLFNE